MATITTRVQGDSPKGSPLTNAEVDNNFINLNTAKYESGDSISVSGFSFTAANPSLNITANTNNWAGINIQAGDTQANYVFFRDADAERARITVLDGDLFKVSTGANVERFRLEATQAVFNDPGNDVDFRVESNLNPKMLYVNAGADEIEIRHSGSYTAKNDIKTVLKLIGTSNDEYSGDTPSAGTALEFRHSWAGGADYSVARISGRAAQTYDGGLQIDVAQNTAAGQTNYTTALQIYDTKALRTFGDAHFNANGDDYSFRVESDTNTHALYVNGTDSRVGINSDASEDGVALQVKEGALQVKDHGHMPSWHVYQASYSYWIKIYEREFQTPNAFGHQGVILDLVGSGSTAGNTHFGRVVITTKQQQAEDGYTITVPEAVGIQFAARFDATGGSNSTGELTVWAKATENYVSLSMWAKHQFQNRAADANHSAGTIMMETTGSATLPSGAIELEPVSVPVGVYYDDGGSNNAVRGVNGYNQNYKTYVSTLISNGGAIINENSADSDFRVESNSNTHMLFVDASQDKVGINASGVYSTLTVNGGIESGDGSGTGGSVVIRQRYAGDNGDYIANWGTEYSSGAPFMSYGLRQSNSEGGWKATYDNFSGNKGVLRLGAGLTFRAEESGNDQTAVGDVVTTYNYFTTGIGGTTFNEDSRNVDFRVESDSNTHMLYMDASESTFSVGTSNAYNGSALNAYKWGSGSSIAAAGMFYGGVGTWYSNLYIGSTSTTTTSYVILAPYDNGGTGQYAQGVEGHVHISRGTSGAWNEASRTYVHIKTAWDNTQIKGFAGNYSLYTLVYDGTTYWALGAVSASSSRNIHFQGNVYGQGGFKPFMVLGTEVSSVSLNRSGNEFLIDGREVPTDNRSVVFNETSSSSHDFRVESNDKTHMVFVDAGNNTVGINEDTPGVKLHITGTGYAENERGMVIEATATNGYAENRYKTTNKEFRQGVGGSAAQSDLASKMYWWTTSNSKTLMTVDDIGNMRLNGTLQFNNGDQIENYEEGTWRPRISNSTGSTYLDADRDCGYVIIGDTVHLFGQCTFTNVYNTISTNTAHISLPATIADVMGQSSVDMMIPVWNLGTSADHDYWNGYPGISAATNGSTRHPLFRHGRNGYTQLTGRNLGGDVRLNFNGVSYRT